VAIKPHPRDLGALTIADDPLINDRYTRQMQAMQQKLQLQYQKDQQEAERKRAQRKLQEVRMS